MAKKKLLNKENPLIIPFGKAVRVGNFKLWRGNYNIASGKERSYLECVYISNLDGSWMVRIPSTSSMFGFICSQYATVDESLRENILGMVFTNVFNCATISSPALHDGFFFLTEMLTFPYLLLSEKDMVNRMEKGMKELGFDRKSRKEHIAKMVEHRSGLYELIERKKAALIEDYERQQAEQRAKEPEEQKAMEQDAIAEEAMEILSEEKGED